MANWVPDFGLAVIRLNELMILFTIDRADGRLEIVRRPEGDELESY